MLYVSVYQAKAATGEWTSLSHSKFRVHTSWNDINEPKIGIEFRFKRGWYSYFENPGDSGANLKLGVKSGSEEVRILKYDYPIPESYSMGPILNYVYKEDLFLPVSLSIEKQSLHNLSLNLEYLVCENSCIPQFADINIALKPKFKSRVWDSIYSKYEYATKVHNGIYEKIDNNIILMIPDSILINEIYPDYNIFNPETKPLTAKKNNNTYLKFALGNLAPRKFYALIRGRDKVIRVNFSDGVIGEIPTDFSPIQNIKEEISDMNLDYWFVLLMAFLGGLLLNVMPCIFPVIALKLMQLVNLGENSDDSLKLTSLSAWMYLSGVLLSFAALGISLELLRQAGAQVGWGFQLQNPAFVAFMTLLFFAISLNLAGVFEVNVSFTRNSADEKGPLQSFITGVLACVVATPCTAPFMATALGYALFLDSQLQRMMLFVFMGFGMAFPIWFIEIFPSIRSKLVNILPKPGPWMVSFRKILAYPMIVASVWLLWVFTRQTGTADLFVVLLALILLTASLQLYQASFYWRAIWRRLIFCSICLIFIAVSLYFSPSTKGINSVDFGYQKFNRQKLEEKLNDAKDVLVIATADWCVSCKFNERLVLQTDSMEDFYREQNVEVMIADWTSYDSQITEYLNSFNRAGVPLYVFYQKGKPKILPQILTKDIVQSAIKNSKEFQ